MGFLLLLGLIWVEKVREGWRRLGKVEEVRERRFENAQESSRKFENVRASGNHTQGTIPCWGGEYTREKAREGG